MPDGQVLTVGGGGSTTIINTQQITEVGGVIGPDSTLDGDIVVFNGEAGSSLRDGGFTIAQVIAAASVAPPAQIAQTSFLVGGGAIVWTSAYSFRVAAAQYYIGGVYRESEEQLVTLAAADETHARIDVIAVNSSRAVVAIKGEAAEQPVEPDVDPSSDLKLGVVFVAANGTEPDGASITNLWVDQAGAPTEWNWSTVGTGFTVGSTSNPRNGVKCIEGTNVAKSAYVQAQIGTGTVNLSTYDTLVVYIRSKATWTANRALKVQWYVSGQAVGSSLTIDSGYWGFSSSITTGYQLVVLPVSQFAVPVGIGVNQLRITGTNGAIGFYLDDISLQQGIPSDLAISALSMNQADARYASLVHASRHVSGGADPITTYRKVGITIDGGASVLTAGVKGSIQVDFVGTIIGWSIQADAAGDVSIAIQKKAGTQTVPAVPNTTTDKISASVPVALSNAQAAGVTSTGVATWTKTVAQWDSIQFEVLSCVTIKRVTLWLRIQEN